MIQIFRPYLCVALLVLLTTACSNEAPPRPLAQEIFSKNLYSASTSRLLIKVHYEPRATPFTGIITGTTNDTWDVSKTSLQGLFANHPGKLIDLPTSLSTMSPLPEQAVQIWDVLRLIQLGQQFHLDDQDTATSTLSVFFLDGLLLGDPKAMGAHFDGTPFVFIFKDAILLAEGDKTQRYLEQSVITHQLGHAIGLVNDGVPMLVAHEDTTNLGHSTDTNDVMHVNLDDRETALTFVNASATADRLLLYGAQSLQDSQNYKP